MRPKFTFLLLLLGVTGCDPIKESVIQTDKGVEKLAVAMDGHAGRGGSIQNLAVDTFDAFRDQKDVLVAVQFYAEWCDQSKQMDPVLDGLAVEFSDRMVVGKVNVDRCGTIAQKEKVMEIPLLRFYRDGVEVDKAVGVVPADELRTRIKQHAVLPPKKEKTAVAAASKSETPKKSDADKSQPTNQLEDGKKAKQPAIQPMKKDWLPPGLERKHGAK